MSGRVICVEIGYEGPLGPIIVSVVEDVPDGVLPQDAIDQAVLQAKAKFQQEYEN